MKRFYSTVIVLMSSVLIAEAQTGTSITNPVPFGQSLTTPAGLTISVTGINLDALTTLRAYRSSTILNPDPPAGQKYILIKVRVTNTSASNPVYVSEFSFDAVGSGGVVRDVVIAFPPDEFGSREIFRGGTVEGNIPFIVPITETGFILLHGFGSDRRYFATGGTVSVPTPTPTPTPTPSPTPITPRFSLTTANSHIFATVADGMFADGTYYRSTLMASNPSGSDVSSCSLSLYGMQADFGSGRNDYFQFTLQPRGTLVMQSRGSATLQSGYGLVQCNTAIDATVLYSYYTGTVKVGEATVFPSTGASQAELIVSQTEGASLGVAIANHSTSAATYTITATYASGATTSTTVTIPARSNSARFLNDLLSSAGVLNATATKLTITSNTGGNLVYAIGLRFTGAVFTTIPATVRGQ